MHRTDRFQKFIFLDRDGVINRDSPEYIKSWAEFHFLPNSLKALRLLTENGFATIIITNQSAVNRKMIPLSVLTDMHARMRAACRSHGAEIHDIFLCPHTPEEQCSCRKPKPGLIFQAREKYGIDLASTPMVGDSARDIACARNAGCGRAILVQTGDIRQARRQLAADNIKPDTVARDLLGAVRRIIDYD